MSTGLSSRHRVLRRGTPVPGYPTIAGRGVKAGGQNVIAQLTSRLDYFRPTNGRISFNGRSSIAGARKVDQSAPWSRRAASH
ncbi:hypothetical protein J6590_077457 [Homalodisca vitripennis]|nr:hypothetical protein J6590_077457 [Homalodisca vitripennis]